MKKLSEIKTGEKFEYEGRYYMGLEAVDDDDYADRVLAIDLETGKTSDVTLKLDTLVRPVELEISDGTDWTSIEDKKPAQGQRVLIELKDETRRWVIWPVFKATFPKIKQWK